MSAYLTNGEKIIQGDEKWQSEGEKDAGAEVK